ncbi:hypothetical protein [Deinococcus koreensis]|uniref:Uncharacterized protein n=1 Tax=Deinococcus koreensis TaxID=2054903 RepID=A0A2K3USR6_9DEIO|nr:hypothetical protein [Deinococcus koreensis]PNY79581.1 hypothetical protein CVO96_18670 [Deinococcus koreensis]
MTPRIKPTPRPHYHQTYPDHLATADELRALQLKPGTTEPDALLRYQRGESSGLCALYDRTKAVPDVSPTP